MCGQEILKDMDSFLDEIVYLCGSGHNPMRKRRLIHGILLVLGISLLGLVFYYALWMLTDPELRQQLKSGWPWESWEMLIDYSASCLITTVVTLYYWRSSILADLIEVNPEKASAYLMDLSKVYRYTLSHLDHGTVSLQEELDFLERYLALLQERFGEGIQVRIATEAANLRGSVPPAVLQMLIENAIKHNEHTREHPLVVDISADRNGICVSNPKRLLPKVDSTSVGQHNIVERYRLLTRKKVRIEETDNNYSVTIPLLPAK